MNLFFTGHDYKYAAEQMLLTLYPDERPVYPAEEPSGDRAELILADGKAVCRLVRGGALFEASAAVRPWSEDTERVRQEQHALKMSFYRAALLAGRAKPAWGALTGVKPGKLMARYLTEGRTAADFARDFDVDPARAALCEQTTRHTLAARDSLRGGDIGLYVGIPFCPTRCAYCSFISNAVGGNAKLVAPYLDALLVEIERTGKSVREAGQRPVSVYFGGGTPTTLSAEQLDRLCSAMEAHFDLSALREYTVEAGRPDTITVEKMAVLRAHGVTRVSVNPQTMNDAVLDAIGRRHTAQDILDALAIVRTAGDFEVNMDLIAGLPRDSEEGFQKTLETVIALAPENITVHTLAMKNGSRLSEHPEVLPGPEAVGRMVDHSMEALRRAGYAPYYLYRQKYMSGGFENVGWAKPGTENLYNILMMEELCPIPAMGAGASTKLTGPNGAVKRKMNPKYPKEYIERILSGEETER
ncbi:MAG: coproporphyrinogen dehydrogenase HemZ [Oscillospiraceae bacterium]